MTKLYEKKHLLDASFKLLCLFLAATMFIILLFVFPTHDSRRDLLIIICLGMLVFVLLILGSRARGYLHLCIKRNPIAILDDEYLKVYSYITNRYTTIKWEEVERCETFYTRDGYYCYPVYIDHAKEPHGLFRKSGMRKDSFRYSYTGLSEDELLALFDKYIRNAKEKKSIICKEHF